MSKLILTGLCTASLGLGACGNGEQEYSGANTNHDRDDDRDADSAIDHRDMGNSNRGAAGLAADNEAGGDTTIN